MVYYISVYIYYVYIYVHTCYVLTSSRFCPHAVNASWFCVLHKFCFTREGAQCPPLVTSLNVFFIFFKAITLFFYVLFKFCFTREGDQGSPLVNPLNNMFLKFMMKRLHNFFKKESLRKRLKDLTILYYIDIILYRYCISQPLLHHASQS